MLLFLIDHAQFQSNDNGAEKDFSFMPRLPRLGSFGTADPISRQRTRTASGSMGILTDSSLLLRAPGSERENLDFKNNGVCIDLRD